LKYLIAFLLVIALCPNTLWAAGEEIVFGNMTDKGPAIYKINADGTSLKELQKGGSFPQWSPNKKLIAYLTDSDDIGILDSEGREITIAVIEKGTLGGKPIKAAIWNYVWSPDSKKIALIYPVLEYIVVQVYDIDSRRVTFSTGRKAQRADTALFSAHLQFSPDSKQLVFSMEGIGERGGLELIDIAAKKSKVIASEGFYAKFWRENILYLTLDEKGSTFWTLKKDGTRKEKLFSTSLIVTPDSSINHDRLFLKSISKEGIFKIFLFDLLDLKLTEVSLKDLQFAQPEFSPDGNKAIVRGSPTSGENGTGYYIINLKNNEHFLLKKIREPEDRDYSWIIMFSGKRNYSWK
jgi:Tol biopolymer transport system component